MPSRYRKKPLAQLEHGTRIYAPSPRRDPVPGRRHRPGVRRAHLRQGRTEEPARAKARELEQLIAEPPPPRPSTRGRGTVGALAGRYVEDHLAALSLRYREKQTYLLRRWILPRLGDLTVDRLDPGRLRGGARPPPAPGRRAPTP